MKGAVNDGSAHQNDVHACIDTCGVSKACFTQEKRDQARRKQRGSPIQGVGKMCIFCAWDSLGWCWSR